MKEVILMMAKMMPMKELVSQIKTSVKSWEVADAANDKEGCKEAEGSLSMACLMLTTRVATEGKDLAEILGDLKNAEKIKAMSPDKLDRN